MLKMQVTFDYNTDKNSDLSLKAFRNLPVTGTAILKTIFKFHLNSTKQNINSSYIITFLHIKRTGYTYDTNRHSSSTVSVKLRYRYFEI